MTRNSHIQVRVSEGEKSAWERWAADEGVSLSELIRRVMVERLAPAEVLPRRKDVVGEQLGRLRSQMGQASAKRSFRPDPK